HLDLGEIIKLMPETATMNDALDKLGKSYSDELKATKDAIDAKEQRYIAESEAQTDEENIKRAQEIEGEKYKLQMGIRIADEDIQKKTNEMLEPIVMKARKAVDDVSKEMGFDYVLDKNSLIVANGTDISVMVKTKLGL
ncbi:MAG: OmpH family outer membrane protein, partial [Urechidicola sp.]|nr:OmpH family outer membrane protein [Urechidicola sp.]